MSDLLETLLDPELIIHPFQISADPRHVTLTPQYKSTFQDIARTVLLKKSMCIVEGPVGTGKTSLARLTMEWSAAKLGAMVNVAYVTDAKFISRFHFVKTVSTAFGLPSRTNLEQQENQLKEFLHEQYRLGKTTVLVVDEAHKLVGDQWDFIQSLFNYHHNETFFIQVMLFAEDRPLQKKLSQKPAIRSRANYFVSLQPLTEEESEEIIRDRLRSMKWREDIFQPDAIRRIWEVAEGRPRNVVKLAGLVIETVGGIPEKVDARTVELALVKYPRFAHE